MTQVFVWDDVEEATQNRRTSAGIVAFARDVEHAREMIRAECSSECEALSREPDFSAQLFADVEAHIRIHPNAGCC